MTQPAGPTAYDVVAYPSGIFQTTHPDHLATIARLHGLTPPPADRARVLEIGGGDGMNLIAMAAAYPQGDFLSFDLAEMPVARGREIVAQTGLGNVRVEVADILDAVDTLDGPFDYIVAHGVYAWVPAPVRDALMALIGRHLSADGVAFVSYNALPGGHFRRVVREMTLHAVAGIDDPDARLAAAHAFLDDFSQPREGERALLVAMRGVARPIARKAGAGLYHDELAEIFEPQSFTDTVFAAAAHGLRFLNESEFGRLGEGLPGEEMSEAEVIRAVQDSDYENMCFFHQTLFVRDTARPSRTPVLGAIRDLYMSVECERTAPDSFRSAEGSFGISDTELAEAIARVAAVWPQRIRVGDLIDDEMRLEAIYRLCEAKAIGLYSVPLPGTRGAGSRPQASALARTLLTMGEQTIFTLDHRAVLLDQPGPRAFLALCDGSRDWAALEADWAASGYAEETDAANALARFASAPLLVG